MVMRKYTKGPWEAMPPLERSFADHGYRIICEVRGKTPHAVYGRKENMVSSLDGNWDAEANACLISAAPDLLEACERLIAEIETRDGAAGPRLCAAYDAATVAIKKAKG